MLDKSFNPAEAEKRIYEVWEKSGAFKPRAAKPTDTKDDNFSIVIPPPNVTGSLHMGHAVNNTIQDILVRFNRMRGKAVLWQPGTDHAGIATQMVVERKLAAEGNRGRKDMSREEFEAKVWDWKHESGGNINQQLRRLGSSCDWSREKFTLGDPDDPNDKMAEAVTKAFVDLYNEGLIYRDKRLVNWDPHFQTAISDLEVENKEIDGHFWHFKYPLAGGETYEYVEKDEDGNVTLRETRDYISIATTRPETMLGDGAVAVHPDDERYAPIVGKMVRLPLANRLIPIITDEYPDPDFGSGAVKITGAHDYNDYDVAKRNDIPMYPLMDERAYMLASDIMPEKYVGMERFKARKAVVADIDAEGLLIKVEDKKVQQPFGDRSNVVIEPMLSDQWFVRAEVLAEQAMAAVERGHADEKTENKNAPVIPAKSGDNRTQSRDLDSEEDAEPTRSRIGGTASLVRDDKNGGQGATRFIPPNWKKTYDIWMKDIQPWCISRQLWWGHRIPAWYLMGRNSEGQPVNPLGKELFSIWVGNSFEEVANKIRQKSGVDEVVEVKIGFGEPEDGLPKIPRMDVHLGNASIDATKLFVYRDEDVLDTWFSSGLWPFSTLGWPDETEELARFYPTSVLVTAFDIIFFWVARMMMQGLHFMGEVPFDDVYIHALVLDEQGKKMSKSEGNVIDPIDLIQGIGIDELVKKRTTGLRQPEKAPQVEKATRKQYPDGFEAYGADALRFTLASMAGMGRNIKLSVDRVAGYRNFGTKLWNAARFMQMNECAVDPDFDSATCTSGINQWMISEAAQIAKTVTRYIEEYRFNDAADAVYKFAWGSYCDWYLELIKPILNGDDAAAKAETRAASAWVFDQILKLLHPFMPFISEELWQETAKRNTDLIVAAWPAELDLDYANANADINWLIDLVSSIRSVRAEMNVPPSKKAPMIVVGANEETRVRLEAYYNSIAPLARVDGFEFADSVPEGALQTVVEEATIALPLAGLIDLSAERTRLGKEMSKIEAEIAKVDGKLGNKNFTDRAPAHVVEQEHTRRAAFMLELEKLKAALDNLPD